MRYGTKTMGLCCRLGLALGAVMLVAGVASAQVPITQLNVEYSQTFDTLANTGTSSTVPTGWTFAESGGNANATYAAGTGSSNGGDTYSFGAASATDRAFGSLASSNITAVTFTVQIRNDTATAFTSVDFSYFVELWRMGAATAVDTLPLGYAVGTTLPGSFTALSDMTASRDDMPCVAAATCGAIDTAKDGNAAAFRVQKLKTGLVVSVPAGSSLWLRWTDSNGTGNDQGFGLDDFKFTAHGSSANTISLTTLGGEYTQSFNTLPSSGAGYSTSLPAGWTYVENAQAPPTWTYATTDGDPLEAQYGTFSVGTTASTERAFGQITILNPVQNPKRLGAKVTNNTGQVLTKLEIAYTGEQWRIGGSGLADRIDFAYSLDATNLITGAWTDVDQLDFSSPSTTPAGQADGNVNKTAITHTITGLAIPAGESFWIRWTDLDVGTTNTLDDDLLAIDDFTIVGDQAVTTLYALKDDNLADNDFVVPDEYISYAIAVGHEMDSDLAATNIVVNDLVPTGLFVEDDAPVIITAPNGALSERVIDANDGDGDGAGFYTTVDGTEIRITLGALALGNDWWTVEFDLLVVYRATAGTITNTARVTSNAAAVTSSVITNFVACVDATDCVADSNVCTTTACTVAGSCENQNNTDSCNDNNNNTSADVCAGGVCTGTACPADTLCRTYTHDGTCDPVNTTAQCNDNNNNTSSDVCTNGTCVGTPCPTSTSVCTTYSADGLCSPVFTTVVCDDLNPATTNDRCNGAGTCVGNTCPTETQCTTYSNDGQCTVIQSTGSCNDGNTGTSNDLCDGQGTCVGTACPVATQCTTYSTDGLCTAIQSTTGCNDDNPGTSNDLCNGAGVCAGTLCPATTTCRSYSNDGLCTPSDLTGPCSDGNNNTSGDTCAAGICVGMPCPTATQCTTYSSDGLCAPIQSTGSCNDGNTGTSNDTCNNGTCAGTPCPAATQCTTYSTDGLCTAIQSTGTCNDNNDQTATDTCNAGTCAGTPIVCNPAPTTCQTANYNGTTCTLSNNAPQSVCDDGLATTSTDRCNAGGVCSGAPIVCAAPTQCQVSLTPNGVDCTVVNKPNTDTCNDGSAFTGNDRCDGAGTCAGTTIVCEAPNQCETAGVPDGTGCPKGFKAATVACDDNNLATTGDLCNGNGGCAGTIIACPTPTQCQTAGVPNGTTCEVGNKPNTATCDDGSATTNNDRCDGTGGCAGTTIVCAEPNQCQTAGVPNGTTCVLGNKPNTATCDDDNDATNDDRCTGNGACAGTTIVCPADTACGSYEPNGDDCTLVPTAGDCDDGDDTTSDDQCVAGECLGTSYECVPSQCELTAVHNGTDCTRTFKDEGALCNDNVNSTRDDVCNGTGTCAGETYGCTPGTCEATSAPDGTGCVSTPAVPGTDCDDANPCTIDDACDGAKVCAGAAVECGDGEICDPAGTCTITHCNVCDDDDNCGVGSNCVVIDDTNRCLLACDNDDDCGSAQVCRTYGEGKRCFDTSGACAAPIENPDEHPETVEPTPEETEPQPEVSEPDPEPEAEVEVGPEITTEPDPEPQVEIAEPTDTSSPDAEAEGVIASGGSGCAGGDASSGVALLLLAGVALMVRRRFAS